MLAYLRVSTDEQGRSGLGLEAQRDAIEREAEHRGWLVAEWIADEASGKSLKRPGIQHALELIEDGGPDILVAAKLDRLARSTLDFLGLVQRAQENGWAIVMLEPNVDMTDPMGKAFATILAAMAELERDMISRRTSEALQRAKARGVKLGGPKVDSHIAKRIRKLRERGATLRTIADELNRDEVPTARHGKRWYPSTVHSVLNG